MPVYAVKVSEEYGGATLDAWWVIAKKYAVDESADTIKWQRYKYCCETTAYTELTADEFTSACGHTTVTVALEASDKIDPQGYIDAIVTEIGGTKDDIEPAEEQ